MPLSKPTAPTIIGGRMILPPVTGATGYRLQFIDEDKDPVTKPVTTLPPANPTTAFPFTLGMKRCFRKKFKESARIKLRITAIDRFHPAEDSEPLDIDVPLDRAQADELNRLIPGPKLPIVVGVSLGVLTIAGLLWYLWPGEKYLADPQDQVRIQELQTKAARAEAKLATIEAEHALSKATNGPDTTKLTELQQKIEDERKAKEEALAKNAEMAKEKEAMEEYFKKNPRIGKTNAPAPATSSADTNPPKPTGTQTVAHTNAEDATVNQTGTVPSNAIHSVTYSNVSGDRSINGNVNSVINNYEVTYNTPEEWEDNRSEHAWDNVPLPTLPAIVATNLQPDVKYAPLVPPGGCVDVYAPIGYVIDTPVSNFTWFEAWRGDRTWCRKVGTGSPPVPHCFDGQWRYRIALPLAAPGPQQFHFRLQAPPSGYSYRSFSAPNCARPSSVGGGRRR